MGEDVEIRVRVQDGATSELRKINGSIDSLQNSVGGVSGAFSKMGAAATIAGGVIIARIGEEALRAVKKFTDESLTAFVDFEHGMAQINTIQKKTGEEFVTLTKDVLKFASTTSFAIGDVQNAIYELNSSGVEAADTMEILAKANVLAIGGFTTMATSADILTTVMNSYGMALEDVDRISDVLIKTQDLGKTTVDEMGASLALVTPIAANLGVTLEELGAMLSTLTIQGVGTSEAITSIRGILVALLKPTTDMEALFAKLGYANGQAMITALGFKGTMDLLNDEISQGNYEAAALFGRVEALNAVMGLGGENAALFTQMLDEMNSAEGVAAENFATMSDTMQYKLAQMKNTIEVFKIQVGEIFVEAFSPLFTKLMELNAEGQLEPLKQSVLSVIKEFINLTKEVLKLFAALLGLNSIQSILTSLASLINGVAKSFEIMARAAEAARKAVSALGIGTAVSRVTSMIGSGLGALGNMLSVRDALITKDGQVIQFHPDDNILATQNGVGGGSVYNNTFYIQNATDPQAVADEIMRRINYVSRTGF